MPFAPTPRYVCIVIQTPCKEAAMQQSSQHTQTTNHEHTQCYSSSQQLTKCLTHWSGAYGT